MTTAAGDNTAVVWDWKTRRKRHVLQHDSAVYSAVFHPTKSEVATASGDGSISVWSTLNGKLLRRRRQHKDAIYCIDYSPDGIHLVSIGGHGTKGDTKCRIWNASDLHILSERVGHKRPAYGVQFSPAGISFATSGGDGLIFLHFLDGSQHRTLNGHTSDVYRCDFSRDGRWFASASQDQSVRIWDLEKCKTQHLLRDGKDPMYDLQFSADGRQLVAVGDDGMVRFWQTSDYDNQSSQKLSSEGLYAVSFTPQQTHVIAGGVDGMLYLQSVPASKSVETHDE